MATVNLVNFTPRKRGRPQGNDLMSGSDQLRIPLWLERGPATAMEWEPVNFIPDEARVLAGLVELFRRYFPQEWEELRLCPLQHGLETMAEKLRFYRS